MRRDAGPIRHLEERLDSGRYGIARAARWTSAAAVLLLPAAVFVSLSLAQPLDRELRLPVVNFLAVTGIGVLAVAADLVLAVAALRIGAYRVLFVALGFVVMGFLFGIDGLTTPGALLPGDPASFDRSVAGVSAFLGLCLPSLLFAAGYTRFIGFLERMAPIRPRNCARARGQDRRRAGDSGDQLRARHSR